MNKEIIKSQAQTIAQVFEKQTQHKMSTSCALEILSALYGHKNYNMLANYIKPETALNEMPAFEKVHAKNAPGDSEYDNECVIISSGGRKLKSPGHPAECSYIRVTDRADHEIAYWASNEWAEDPEIVMGAIMGALKGHDESLKLPQFAVEKKKNNGIKPIAQPLAPEELKRIIEDNDGLCEVIISMSMDSFYDGIDAVNDFTQYSIVGDNTVEFDGEDMRVSVTDISYEPVGAQDGIIFIKVSSVLTID